MHLALDVSNQDRRGGLSVCHARAHSRNRDVPDSEGINVVRGDRVILDPTIGLLFLTITRKRLAATSSSCLALLVI